MNKRLLIVLALFSLAGYSLVSAATGSLSTNVTSDGGCEGTFFDLTALTEDIYITGFETNFVGTANVRVYYKPGTFAGSEDNAAVWTLLGSETITGGSGFIQTLYSLHVGGLTIPAGQTYGILIYSGTQGGSGGLATRYRGYTTLSFDNGDLAFSGGSASCLGDPLTPFDGHYTERVWRGTVLYGDPPAPEETGAVVKPAPTEYLATAEDHARAQAPLCQLIGSETDPIAKADVADGTVPDGNVYCRVIARNGEFLYGNTPSEIGDSGVLDQTVLQAVDVSGMANGAAVIPFEHPVTICLRGEGTLWYLDAATQPRAVSVLDSGLYDGWTCGVIPHAGMVVLAGDATQVQGETG